jgi:hypothetical protein
LRLLVLLVVFALGSRRLQVNAKESGAGADETAPDLAARGTI